MFMGIHIPLRGSVEAPMGPQGLAILLEKVTDKSCLTLDVTDITIKGRDRNLSYNQIGFNTKKIVNGEVQPQLTTINDTPVGNHLLTK